MKKVIMSIVVAVFALFAVATTAFASGEVGEITSPDAGEAVSGMVTFSATYTDDDPSGVDWAVRSGTCGMDDAYTVFGNVGGHSDAYDWDGADFIFSADVSGLEDGDYCFIFNPREGSGDDAVRETQWFAVDNAPAKPTGLKRRSQDGVVYACGDTAKIQLFIPDWDDNTESDLSHYEYSSFNPGSQGLDEEVMFTSEFVYTGLWLPGEGTYGYAVRAVDEAGNKSEWSIDSETLEGSCQITYDSTRPEITLNLPDGGTYDGDVPFEATCNEDCSYINFWWTKKGEAFDPIDRQYHYVRTVGMLFNWTLDSLAPEYWKNDVRGPMDDGEYNVYAAGKDVAGNWARTPVQTFIIDRDLDDDGVLNAPDMCENTVDDVLLGELGTNRWAWYGLLWNTHSPAQNGKLKGKTKGPDFTVDMNDVHGCSCIQILDWLQANDPEEYGDMLGLYKYGCTKGIIEDFMELTAE